MAGRFSPAQVSTGPDKSPLKTLLLGGPGVGKSYLLSTVDGIFIVPVEEGAKGHCPHASPGGFRDAHENWIAPRTLAELLDAMDTFLHEVNLPVVVQGANGPTKRRPFRHFGIDSLSGIESLVHAAACEAEGVPHMEGADYKRVWNAALAIWETVKQKLEEIRRSGVHVWIVAHATEAFRASETTGETFRRWDLMLRGSNQTLEEIRQFWRGWADNVLFLTHDVEVAKGTKTRRPVAKIRARILVTCETGTVYAKNRLALPPVLSATWRDLQAAITGRAPEPPGRAERARKEVLKIAAALVDQQLRAELERDLAAARTPAQLAQVLSRAQGLRAMLEDDDEPTPATSAEPGDDDTASGSSAKPAPAPARAQANGAPINGAAAH